MPEADRVPVMWEGREVGYALRTTMDEFEVFITDPEVDELLNQKGELDGFSIEG